MGFPVSHCIVLTVASTNASSVYRGHWSARRLDRLHVRVDVSDATRRLRHGQGRPHIQVGDSVPEFLGAFFSGDADLPGGFGTRMLDSPGA